jgi:hypothetical protein
MTPRMVRCVLRMLELWRYLAAPGAAFEIDLVHSEPAVSARSLPPPEAVVGALAAVLQWASTPARALRSCSVAAVARPVSALPVSALPASALPVSGGWAVLAGPVALAAAPSLLLVILPEAEMPVV